MFRFIAKNAPVYRVYRWKSRWNSFQLIFLCVWGTFLFILLCVPILFSVCFFFFCWIRCTGITVWVMNCRKCIEKKFNLKSILILLVSLRLLFSFFHSFIQTHTYDIQMQFIHEFYIPTKKRKYGIKSSRHRNIYFLLLLLLLPFIWKKGIFCLL